MTSIIKVDTIQDQDGNNIINENADTITIGASGDTITIPAGATLSNLGTASGFGLTWQSVQTTGFTAVKGNAYPCDTTSAAFTVTLPATPSAGDQVQLVDYAGTFDTNALVINPNGEDIEGSASNVQLSGEREGVILTYIDSTQGWIATSGINEGTDALEPITYSVDFLVIAGGGSGGCNSGGGGGAGGYRNSFSTEPSGGGGSSEASLTFTGGTVYTVTVGAGGASVNGSLDGNNGFNSELSGTGISTITSTAGGYGGGNAIDAGGSGGSGGGGSGAAGGSGTANQGFGGENAASGGGGGGAGEAGGTDATYEGGDGLASSITGSSITRAGGGGGRGGTPSSSGGAGGGGDGSGDSPGVAGSGTVNTGSGGGGTRFNQPSGAGGKGVVILRMPDASYSGTTTGSPTVTTGVGGTDTVLVFNDSGSYTG
jgi:hypothetical protein